MKGLIIPKYSVDTKDFPIIFLFGPIKGAGRWQNRGIDIIEGLDFDGYVACPNRNIDERHRGKLAQSNQTFDFALDWERHYWEKALVNGAGMFWLPKQVEFDIPQIYARETRGELGEVRGMLRANPNLRVLIGGEEGFEGLDLVKRNYQAVKRDIKFYNSLEEECREAVRLAK